MGLIYEIIFLFSLAMSICLLIYIVIASYLRVKRWEQATRLVKDKEFLNDLELMLRLRREFDPEVSRAIPLEVAEEKFSALYVVDYVRSKRIRDPISQVVRHVSAATERSGREQ